MNGSSRLPFRLSVLALFWGTLFSILLQLSHTPVMAQQSSLPPIPASSMAYTTIDEDMFYMQGGVIYGPAGPTTNQFYALDLTQPTWTTSKPPWKAMVYPETLNLRAKNNKHSISVSPDKQNLTFWVAYPGLVLNYTIATDTWTEIPKPSQLTSAGDLHPVTDPRTGLVYNPGGYNNVSMGVYNPATQGFIPATSPNGYVNDRFYAFVWSEVRNTFIFFGNTLLRDENPFLEYSTSANRWAALPATGDTPPYRRRSCMVPAYNGTKMLLFGGDSSSSEPSVGMLHILDVRNMIWSKTEGVDPSLGRSSMACAVSGDNFIVWGGVRFQPGSTPQDAPGTPLIYNIHTGKWTDTFIRGTHFDPNAPNPGPPSSGKGGDSEGGDNKSSGGETKSSGAAIGGGVAAIIVIIALIAFYVIRRRRQQRDLPIHTKDFKAVPSNDHILPSMENSHSTNPPSAPFHDVYSQVRPKERELVSYPPPPQQCIAAQDIKTGLDNRAQAGPQMVPFTPPPMQSFSSINPQDHVQQLQHRREKLASPSPNPQYNPYGSEMSDGDGNSVPRGPQGVGEPVFTGNGGGGHGELQQQINTLQAELKRLQARLDS